MRRCVSLFLCVLLCLPVYIPISVSANDSGQELPVVGVLYDTNFVSMWNTAFDKADSLGLFVPDAGIKVLKSDMWTALDRLVAKIGFGGFTEYSDLVKGANYLNTQLKAGSMIPTIDFVSDPVVGCLRIVLGGLTGNFKFGVVEHAEYGYVIHEENTGLVVCNSLGAFPYYKTVKDTSDPDAPTTDTALGGQWIRMDKINSVYNVVNEATLDDLGSALILAGNDLNFCKHNNKYLVIQSERTESGIPFLYCDSKGRPYAQQLNTDEWFVNNSNNYYTEDTNGDGAYDEGQTENSTLIDLDSNVVWFPDGTLNFINNLIYDESTKTYYVDAHSEYDIDNNIYITNNYHYEYHIDYTSITYIGQTAEYDKTYELYYQLPDGRNSADLTVEELQALNTQIDVLPYIRSADDISIRALYHFDGNTRDSSYWSHLGEFKWNKGASITYMESGAFNGALYLDENAHDFTVTLPSNLGPNDWTVQFRYYQSHTVAPVTDSSISIGDVTVATLDGSTITVGGTSVPISVGQWQELCFMRSGYTCYFFHNGVLVSTFPMTFVLGDTVDFAFGSNQQTYKYFDELRVTNKALYSADGYAPTSVPFDTNLALVLPDSQLPIADEYWSIRSSYDNLLTNLALDNWTNSEPFVSSGLVAWNELNGYVDGTYYNYYYHALPFAPFYNSSISSLTDTGGSAQLVTGSGSFATALAYSAYTGILGYDGFMAQCVRPTGGLILPIAHVYSDNKWVSYSGVDVVGDLTFSLVDSSANIYSVTATIPAGTSGDYGTSMKSTKYSEAEFDDFFLSIWGFSIKHDSYSTRSLCLCVQPKPGCSVDFIYLEAVKNSSTDLTVEWVESVVAMDKDDLNTPSLAVRTDLDITGYQIGGVRPSLPEKGLVWALVEDGRITSLQIYNGQAWEEVDGRIWTGSRWVPYYAYDVLLLKDLYDIIEGDPSLDYIYTQEGFWTWLQKSWGQMMGKLDQIIAALGGDTGPTSNCEHVYESEVTREPGCAEPGNRTYTCTECGHTYVELIDATGHDWTVTGHVPDVLDDAGNIVDKGYDELTCSVCEAEGRDYGNGPETTDLFDALGDLIADGISWVLDKLTQLADSLRSITEIFTGFTERMSSLAGGFPLFFGAFVALLPEDLSAVLWFAVITAVILAVWRSWSR